MTRGVFQPAQCFTVGCVYGFLTSCLCVRVCAYSRMGCHVQTSKHSQSADCAQQQQHNYFMEIIKGRDFVSRLWHHHSAEYVSAVGGGTLLLLSSMQQAAVVPLRFNFVNRLSSSRERCCCLQSVVVSSLSELSSVQIINHTFCSKPMRCHSNRIRPLTSSLSPVREPTALLLSGNLSITPTRLIAAPILSHTSVF